MVNDFSSGFPRRSDDVLVVENEIVEETAPLDSRDLTSIHNRDPSPLQCIRALCRDDGLSVPPDIQAVRGF